MISPMKKFEKCLTLSSNQILEYAFIVTKPVVFDIHYHSKKETFYGLKKDTIEELNGIFQPGDELKGRTSKKYYCMMWDNTDTAQARLVYDFNIRMADNMGKNE